MTSLVDAIVWVADGEATPDLDYGRRLEEQMERQGLRVARASLEDPDPALLDAAPLHLLTGGATSVNADEGWMPRALEHTRLLVERSRSGFGGLLGICLGAQMIAASSWDQAVAQGDRIEVGLTPVQWKSGEVRRDVVASFHYESLRPEAVVSGGGRILASNEHTEVQAFSIGSSVLGVQFHPELTPDDMRAVVHHHRGTVEAFGGDVEAALGSVETLGARWSPLLLGELIAMVKT